MNASLTRVKKTEHVRVILTKQNINTVSRSKFLYLFFNNHTIIDILKMRTIISISAIVKIIIDYESSFYS